VNLLLGIRREDKNEWERRVPLVPQHLKELKEKYDVKAIVQTSPIRAFLQKEYENAGIKVQEDLSPCPVIFAVKEIPISFFEPNKTYVFFSHVIKGQKYNMPKLKKMMDLECNLIDYEKIADENGRRLVFFGRFAGLAGMIDTLWSFGQRLKSKKIDTPFNEIKQTIHYKDLGDVKEHLKEVGEKIKEEGIPKSLTPLVIGFAGYGHVSKGAQEILDILPVKEISPKEIKDIYDNPSNHCIYKVVFKEKDMVEPILSGGTFELQDYYDHPEKYRSVFEKYIPELTMLMNCIYWDARYPRLVTKKFIKGDYEKNYRLQVIGDISIDINGAIEFTEKSTTPDIPSFVYNPETDSIKDGVEGKGIVIMAVDTLPCELPRESSQSFSDSLLPFVSDIVKADYTVPFEKLNLPSEVKKAVILYHGKLTPDYQYMNKFL
jgi:alpha-aminoadipic semialdehyde synthase